MKYRLVKETWRNHIEREDGSGSLADIVSHTVGKRTVWSRDIPEKECNDFKQRVSDKGFNRIPLPYSANNGWIDYSYILEKQADEASEWEYVMCVSGNCESEESWYRRHERW